MSQGLSGNSSITASKDSGKATGFDLEKHPEIKAPCPFAASGLPMPTGHEQYSDKDKGKCPVMSGKIKAPISEPHQIDSKPEESQDGAKKKKPKGGCPFMPSGIVSYLN